jgi:hypothetical protein
MSASRATPSFVAGGAIAWIAYDDGMIQRAIWDNGRYRLDLLIGNVDGDPWTEDDLDALIEALAPSPND